VGNDGTAAQIVAGDAQRRTDSPSSSTSSTWTIKKELLDVGLYLLCDADTKDSEYVFVERVAEGSTVDSTYANRISGCRSLSHQGLYCYHLRAWRRYYLTSGVCSSVPLRLYEDVTESGGQNSLWSAGLVMANYIDKGNGLALPGKRVLDMGAGAGLTSMVAAVGGAGAVVATEQPTCMAYLTNNLAMNKHVPVDARPLYWTTDEPAVPEQEQFDLVLACDVTYDPSLFDALLCTMKGYLKRAGGVALVCHDNDSCPLSPAAEKGLTSRCVGRGISFDPVDLTDKVDPPFYEKSVRMWRLAHDV